MCNVGIAWSEFDWQSFATLVTGLAAVIAAVFVAIRQARIFETQTKLLERQITTDEIRLKTELYQRRIEVYSTLHGILESVVLNIADMELSDKATGFFTASFEGKLIFSSKVKEVLEALDLEFIELMDISIGYHANRGVDPNVKAPIDKVMEVGKRLSDDMFRLRQVIRHDLEWQDK